MKRGTVLGAMLVLASVAGAQEPTSPAKSATTPDSLTADIAMFTLHAPSVIQQKLS
jgi:hypothetical protein